MQVGKQLLSKILHDAVQKIQNKSARALVLSRASLQANGKFFRDCKACKVEVKKFSKTY